MVRGVAKRSLSQRCVGLGGSPRGIAEFGKGIASSRGEWLSGEEQLDTAVELGWWNAGLAGGAIQEHAGCKNKQLPATHFVVGLRPVRMAVRRAPGRGQERTAA